MDVDTKGAIPKPRTAGSTDDTPFGGMTVWHDGLVHVGRSAPTDVDELIAISAEHVVADLVARARRLQDTREPFPANPYRLAAELLDSGKLPFQPKNREAVRELLARMYRNALQAALVA